MNAPAKNKGGRPRKLAKSQQTTIRMEAADYAILSDIAEVMGQSLSETITASAAAFVRSITPEQRHALETLRHARCAAKAAFEQMADTPTIGGPPA